MNVATIATDGEWLRISFSCDGGGVAPSGRRTPRLSAIGWNREEKRKIAFVAPNLL
jgi:hypothetical protein